MNIPTTFFDPHFKISSCNMIFHKTHSLWSILSDMHCASWIQPLFTTSLTVELENVLPSTNKNIRLKELKHRLLYLILHHHQELFISRVTSLSNILDRYVLLKISTKRGNFMQANKMTGTLAREITGKTVHGFP